jgi:hypothetical protein
LKHNGNHVHNVSDGYVGNAANWDASVLGEAAVVDGAAAALVSVTGVAVAAAGFANFCNTRCTASVLFIDNQVIQ